MKSILKYMIVYLIIPVSAYGATCPSTKTARNGIILRNSSALSEYRPIQGSLVLVTNKFNDSSKQTVYSFHGLIDLSRSGDNEHYNIYPLSDLNKLLPLKQGAHHAISFVPLNPEESGDKWTLDLTVTGRETFVVGRCKYDVFRIRQEIKRGNEQVDLWSALYSPDLRATLAKIYDEGTDNEAIVRYEYVQVLNP